MIDQDQQVLEYIIKALVSHPESVKITRTIDERGVLLLLDVHTEDMGKVIGKMGNTAKAVRTILRVVGIKNGARVNLKINEPLGSTHQSRPMADGESMTTPVGASVSTPTQSAAIKSVDEAMADLEL